MRRISEYNGSASSRLDAMVTVVIATFLRRCTIASSLRSFIFISPPTSSPTIGVIVVAITTVVNGDIVAKPRRENKRLIIAAQSKPPLPQSPGILSVLRVQFSNRR